MVRTLKKMDPWRTSKRNYQRRASRSFKTGTPLYPPVFDSTVIYVSSYANITITGAGQDYSASFYADSPSASAQMMNNMALMYSNYRIEKVTVTGSMQDTATLAAQNIIQACCCTTHDNFFTPAQLPTILNVRAFRDCQILPTDNSIFKKVWFFNTADPDETAWRRPVAAAIDSNYGGVFFAVQVAGAPNANAYVLCNFQVKFKVRLSGRSGMSF